MNYYLACVNIIRTYRAQVFFYRLKLNCLFAYPGYIIVQMELNDKTWHLVKDTPKIMGFAGNSQQPKPMSEREVASLMKQIHEGASKVKPKLDFSEGDLLKIIDGPFNGFTGTIDEIKPDKRKLRVLVSIFGRSTPVELGFSQVEKA